MVTVYTDIALIEGREVILFNDEYFFLHSGGYNLESEEAMKVISVIDHAKPLAYGKIETPFGITNVGNLSSGCKTYLNALFNPDAVVSLNECGQNVLPFMYSLSGRNYLMTFEHAYPYQGTFVLNMNNQALVENESDYYAWWEGRNDLR